MNRACKSLAELYSEADKVVVTGHRGFPAEHPENTILSFEKAVEAGADIVEFDVRLSRDGIPVILHDETLDRTTDGTGPAGLLTLGELKRLNASFWSGPHDTGRRLERPALADAKIPTLDEALGALSGAACVNIQVYCDTDKARELVSELYSRHKLHGRGFLMVGSFAEAEKYRAIDPGMDLCVGEDRGNLARHVDFGLRIVQPWRGLVDKTFCSETKRLGLWANMFYANTAEDALAYLDMGVRGIMTDDARLVLDAVESWKKSRPRA